MTNFIKNKISLLTPDLYDSDYKIHYEDGRYEILKGKDIKDVIHVKWKANRGIRVAELKEYLTVPSLKSRLYIDLPNAEIKPSIDLPIHPYLLGCLLGDGGLSRRCIILTTADGETIDKCSDLLPKTLEFIRQSKFDYRLRLVSGSRNSIATYFRTTNLNVTSAYKFIPLEYLESSLDQRIDLIKGLMDTDGTISKEGHSSFTTASYQLAYDFQRLIRSIGGLAKMTTKQPIFTYKGITKKGLIAYTVHIRVKCPKILFSLQRKLDRAPVENQYSKILKLRIKKVEILNE